MRILLTNDDGIEAPGIKTLAEVASEYGEVVVAAPAHPCSGCGHRIITDREVEVVETSRHWFRVDGFPADCVRLALTQFAPNVDLVLSGINDGANLGADVHVSGTVAGVREAALFRVPGIALSQFRNRPSRIQWEQSAALVRRVLNEWLAVPHPPLTLLNVNLPDPLDTTHSEPWIDSIPIVECLVDSSPLPYRYEQTPKGYRYCGIYQERDREPTTDVQHCMSGAITVSRVRVG